nr:hypothetical protein [Clostridium sp. C2-6-12]
MDLEKEDYYRDLKGLYDECKRCMYYHAILKMKDGNEIDGIIENVDPDRIIVLVGEDMMEPEGETKSEGQRQYYNNYGPPRRRFRRFRRQAFPLATLAALSLLPYPILPPYPYPYYYPYY